MRLRGRTIGFVLFGAVTLGSADTLGSVAATTPAWAASRPSVPAVPKTAPGNRQARLNWVAPANGGSPITGYVVTPFIGKTAQAPRTFKSAALIEIVTGLTNGTTYTFRVAAKNVVGTGPPSGASMTVMPTTQPTLKITANATMGQPILVNSYGRTVYLFTPDSSQNPERTSTEGGFGFRSTWPFVSWSGSVGSSRVDLQACKLEYSIVSPK